MSTALNLLNSLPLECRDEPKRTMIKPSPEGLLVVYPTKDIVVENQRFKNVDPRELMRIIKYITQTIGESKDQGNMYSRYVIPALRKTRSEVVADLETHFRITWRINEKGKSEFAPM